MWAVLVNLKGASFCFSVHLKVAKFSFFEGNFLFEYHLAGNQVHGLLLELRDQ